MGIKWLATLRVEFEMEDGQPETLPDIVLRREVGNFRNSIETGIGTGLTRVKRGSAKVTILSSGRV